MFEFEYIGELSDFELDYHRWREIFIRRDCRNTVIREDQVDNEDYLNRGQ